ncbi:hypothetical protein E6C70_15690 [Glaciibacter flavus]|uniref:Uncharacterized protein n=1 Tax=Orlajensenia flava TaxID=2565934 RepID=A0A4S4FFS5_9MICO|nr:hypothetical protein [Glaciibacter flavus]THG29060.1 hypothetical protein E6C70_15690 [Glaciibacter flavus]
MRIRSVMVGAVAGAALTLVLAGCSASPSSSDAASTHSTSATASATATPTTTAAASGDQTKVEACDIMKNAQSGFAALNDPAKQAELKADPAKAAATFQQLQGDMDAGAAQVTNTEVAGPAKAAAASVHDYFDFIQAVSKDPSKASELGDHLKTLSDAMVSLQTTCA